MYFKFPIKDGDIPASYVIVYQRVFEPTRSQLNVMSGLNVALAQVTFFGDDGMTIMGILATPPKATPPRNKTLLRVY